MNDQTLNINLADRSAVTNPYWLHMEIVAEDKPDGLTVAEAADIIDATYNITLCEQQGPSEMWSQPASTGNNDIWDEHKNEDNFLLGTDEQEAANLEAQKRFADAIVGYDAIGCREKSGIILYTVEIKVFRSHQDELYKLQMSNGIASTPSIHTGRVIHTRDIDKQTSVTLDNPITGNPIVIWQGIDNGPSIHITGNTLHWDGEFTGTLRAEFDTTWDQLTISVTGESLDSELITGTDQSYYGTGWYAGTEDSNEISDYNNNECAVLGFYHYQYEELILEEPEPDNSTSETDKINICSFITRVEGAVGDTREDSEEKDCSRHVLEEIICQCGSAPDKESNSYYEAVACPAGVSPGTTLQGTREFKSYKDCGYRDEVNDPAFYEEKCCEEWPFEEGMPLCKKITTVYNGSGEEADILGYPEGTAFVIVSPSDGQCGEYLIEQVVNALQCCDGVPPLVWDYEESVDVMAPESRGVIVVTGGRMPRTVKVRGKGFYLDAAFTQRDGLVSSESFYLYTSDEACGIAYITVIDGCSSVLGAVRSTQGVYNGTCYAYSYHIEDFNYTFSSPNIKHVGCSGLNIIDTGADAPSRNAEFAVYRWNGSTWGRVAFINDFLSKSSCDALVAYMDQYYHTCFAGDTTPPNTVNPCGCIWEC